MMAPRVLHDDGGSQPLTEGRRRQQGSDSLDSCPPTATTSHEQGAKTSPTATTACTYGSSSSLLDTLAHYYTPPHCTPGPSPYAYKRKVQGSRTRRLAARENGLADGLSLSLSLSLSPSRTLVTPLLQAHPTWAQGNMKAAGFPFCLSLPPSVLRLAPTHLGWDTRRQFTRLSRDPPGSKRRHFV
jgi:hypothetical protein